MVSTTTHAPRRPQRLTLVVTSLEAGGAERVLSGLANAWAAAGKAITFVTLTGTAGDFYRLDGRITRVALDVLRRSHGWLDAVIGNIWRIMRLRRAIRRSAPDVVIAFTDQTNVITLVATRFLGVPVVVSERTDPTQHEVGRWWVWARKRTYRWAAGIVVQTRAVRRWAEQIVPVDRIAVIPNPVLAPEFQGRGEPDGPSGQELPHPLIAAMGSLVPLKGFDALLRAFAAATAAAPEWHLVIMGDGPERTRLLQEAAVLGIADRVHLPGRMSQPERVLACAEMFVLSSRFEGFPNALLEAMSCGCAAVSFDCPSGPSEIVRHGIDGVLVPPGDENALASAILRLVHDPALRRQLGAGAREVNERFSQRRVMDAWDEILESRRR